MASKNGIVAPPTLSGQAAIDASRPLAQTPRGGAETGFTGESNVLGKAKQLGAIPTIPGTTGQVTPSGETGGRFAGLGPWLEADAATVFETANNLVLRQEIIAMNHLAQDTYYTRVKLGFPFMTLEKDPNKDTYRTSIPVGMRALSIQAVPNQAWDLVNKATEALLVDPPQPDPSPRDDSEQAHASAEMAERFLTEDGGEQGTDDIALLYNAVDKSLTCASSYIEYWTDPVGGGYVPLEILAHPQAVDPANPTIGPDGNPTTDLVLRYLTAPEGGQFTEDPMQAAPQWQPKIRANVWGREHWRIFPESVPVAFADKLIGLLYCTIAEAKRRWPDVAAMEQGAIDALLSWQPPRFLVLLPPFQRSRWAVTNGNNAQRSGAGDERIIFFYRVLQRANPDYTHGAEVIVSGVGGGTILHREVLAAEVTLLEQDGQSQKQLRCLDVPVAQMTPRADPDERDPSGRCFMELFSGATEFNAAMVTAYLEAINIWLHPDSYVPSTTTVQGYQVQESRVTGDAIQILKPEDKPTYGNMPPIPNTFWEGANWNDQAIRSIASLNKPVTGQDTSKEVSGKARQIAVQQGMIGLSRMQRPVNTCFERMSRIKLQLAMRDFTTPQLVRYVGEDGVWKEQQFTGTDFALVNDSVGTQAGTGTMLSPEAKTQFIANLQAEGMLPPDEAADAARPTYAQRLGLPDDPHDQYIERCITAWLKGPPEGWAEHDQQYQAEQQQLAPQMQEYQTLQTVAAQTGQPMTAPPPQSTVLPPWSPFQPRLNDAEPRLAEKWMKRLSRVMSTNKYSAADPRWRATLDAMYTQESQVVAASQPAPALPKGVSLQAKADSPEALAAEERAAANPASVRPTQPTAPTHPTQR